MFDIRTYVDKYIENFFEMDQFLVLDDFKYFQGKRLIDVSGDFIIVEGVPFKNSVLVHYDNRISKYIFDDTNNKWVLGY